MTEPGKRTSIYLPADVAEAAAVSGLSLSELVRRGLASLPGARLEAKRVRAAAAASTAHDKRPLADTRPLNRLGEPCDHPRARVLRGLCSACGTFAGDGKPGKAAHSG